MEGRKDRDRCAGRLLCTCPFSARGLCEPGVCLPRAHGLEGAARGGHAWVFVVGHGSRVQQPSSPGKAPEAGPRSCVPRTRQGRASRQGKVVPGHAGSGCFPVETAFQTSPLRRKSK